MSWAALSPSSERFREVRRDGRRGRDRIRHAPRGAERLVLRLAPAAALCTSTLAWADPPPRPIFSLEYTRAHGAENCPDEQVFRDAVGVQMGRDPFAEDAATRLVVTIVRKGGGYVGNAELYDSAGISNVKRDLGPVSNCESLVEALGFAVSIKLDPTPPLDKASPAVAAVPSVPAKPERSPPLPEVTPPSPPRASILARGGVGTWLGFATAPGLAFGLTLDLGVRGSFWSASIEGRWDPPAGADMADGARVSTSRLTGALVPCGHFRILFGCLVGELGQLRGSAEKVDHPKSDRSLYAAAGLRLGVEVPVWTHLAVRVSGEALRTVQPTTFLISGKPEWTTPSYSAAAGVGVVTFF